LAAIAVFAAADTYRDHVRLAELVASNRAAAELFAMQHGLLPEEELPARVPG